jgi:hypothetical protein
MGKPLIVGTVWVARATLYDKRMKPVATCVDTPNAIARAFMEVPHAVAVKGLLGRQDRADYLSRMQSWNVAESHVSVFMHPKEKGKARKPRLTR